MSELENGFRIGDVVAMVQRRWPIVVGAAVVGLIAAYLVFASAPTTYSATARVQVKPITLDQFGTDGKTNVVDIETEKDLVRSDSVAGRAMDVVELVPKTDDLPYAKAVVWIDRQDGLVRRVEIEETSGQQRTLVLTQLAVNRGVPGREFTFSPPAGLRVVDQ